MNSSYGKCHHQQQVNRVAHNNMILNYILCCVIIYCKCLYKQHNGLSEPQIMGVDGCDFVRTIELNDHSQSVHKITLLWVIVICAVVEYTARKAIYNTYSIYLCKLSYGD